MPHADGGGGGGTPFSLSRKLFSSVLYLIWPQYTAKGANAVGSDTRFMRFYFICVQRRSLSRIFMAATNQEGYS